MSEPAASATRTPIGGRRMTPRRVLLELAMEARSATAGRNESTGSLSEEYRHA